MAEAVGIVLALIPLVISCCKSYDKVAQSVRTFKKYTKSVKTHISILRVQQTIFLKANQRLLAHCVGDRDLARSMLADSKHSGWHNEELCTIYLKHLADARGAFEDLIALISDELATIERMLSTFHTVGSGLSDQDQSLKKKIKYAIKHSTIDASLQTLAERTRELVTLLDLTGPAQSSSAQFKSTLRARNQVSRFSDIQDIALDLYNALGHACTKHTGHQAHLGLQSASADPAQVRFSIAFSQLTLGSPEDEQHPCSGSTWLTIESRLTGRLQAATDTQGSVQALQTLKRTFAESVSPHVITSVPKKAPKNEVHVLDPCGSENPAESCPPEPSAQLKNLCTQDNFCNVLRRFTLAARPCTEAIGYLDLSGHSKHLIYIDSRSLTITSGPNVSGSLRSLYKLLRAIKSDTTQSLALTIPNKISIAHQLATAILQFHATPWLRPSWSSTEIIVFSTSSSTANKGEGESVTAQEAYVSAQIRGPHDSETQTSTIPSPVVVRNALLFRLGVMLLEIAYVSPLSDMTIDRDRHSSDTTYTEFFTADRLCRQVSAHMGPKYAEVVRKCIHCDFGCDFDLKLSKLQESFYQHVVCELGKLAEGLKEW